MNQCRNDDGQIVESDDGDLFVDFKFIDMDDLGAESDGGNILDQLDKAIGDAIGTIERLEELLRAAGIDVTQASSPKDEETQKKEAGAGKESGEDRSKRTRPESGVKHEEL